MAKDGWIVWMAEIPLLLFSSTISINLHNPFLLLLSSLSHKYCQCDHWPLTGQIFSKVMFKAWLSGQKDVYPIGVCLHPYLWLRYLREKTELVRPVCSPGEMHSLLARHTKVEVSCVLHLICVASLLNPMANGVTVDTVHQIVLIIHTTSVMMGPIAWISKPRS